MLPAPSDASPVRWFVAHSKAEGATHADAWQTRILADLEQAADAWEHAVVLGRDDFNDNAPNPRAFQEWIDGVINRQRGLLSVPYFTGVILPRRLHDWTIGKATYQILEGFWKSNRPVLVWFSDGEGAGDFVNLRQEDVEVIGDGRSWVEYAGILNQGRAVMMHHLFLYDGGAAEGEEEEEEEIGEDCAECALPIEDCICDADDDDYCYRHGCPTDDCADDHIDDDGNYRD